MTDAIASTLLRSSFTAFTVEGTFEVFRATAVTSWPRLVSSCKIRWPEFPVAPYSTTFILILLFLVDCFPQNEEGNACDNTYMSVATRIWIQGIIEIALFFGIALQTARHEHLTGRCHQFRRIRFQFAGVIPVMRRNVLVKWL